MANLKGSKECKNHIFTKTTLNTKPFAAKPFMIQIEPNWVEA